MKLIRALALDELWEGEKRAVSVGGRPLLLIHTAGEKILAYDDRCAHLGVPLSRGQVDGERLTCAVHGWIYRLPSGESENPRGACLKRYPTEIHDDAIWVALDE